MPKKNKAAEQARMQTKAFTKWANSHLKIKGIKMTDITKDLSSGLNLCYMLSSMTGETIKPPNNSKKVIILIAKALQQYMQFMHTSTYTQREKTCI